jgi:hypothetical protein
MDSTILIRNEELRVLIVVSAFHLLAFRNENSSLSEFNPVK